MSTLSPNLRPRINTRSQIKPLRLAHQRFVESGEMPADVRGTVAESWRRCRTVGVDAGNAVPPVPMTDDDLGAYRDSHPLAEVLPVFRQLLGDAAEDSRYLMAVADADACLLWVEGHSELRRRAEKMTFIEGASWAEQYAGTNAPGTAIAAERPVRIFAAEHFSEVVQPWSCAAAPIRDPRTGELLGVIDITGGDHIGSPASLALVRACALAAEGELRRRRPRTPVDAESEDVSISGRLEVMGQDGGILTLGGRRQRLSRRHAEILALLAQRPDGLSAEQLSCDLYGADANPTTLRAEMVRIRKLLGDDILESRPYRLRVGLSVDLSEILDLVHHGSVAEALDRYRGPLLPRSQAPVIEEERRRIEQQVRASLIGDADPELLTRWLDTPWGRDDCELWELLAQTTPNEATHLIAKSEVYRLADDVAASALPRPSHERVRAAVGKRGVASFGDGGRVGRSVRGEV